ncbi:hypothetical protein [Candidatus Protochlamydia sp. W-9]|uniref:hypothetical protein n=1 Tax=Candidatus Protochlamydia sp. W-9 TaxID=1785087 RepID=UPI00096A5A66|nr:hypothetical protein [Candidatus Protochlamydia sp. W-9]
MKFLKTILLITVLAVVTALPLTALSMGRLGEPFEREGHTWQKVYYEDEKRSIQADLPGSPIAGFSNGVCYLYSQYQNVNYEVHLAPSEKFKAPKKMDEFIALFKNIPNATIHPLVPDRRKVRYMVQVEQFNETKSNCLAVARIYATEDTLYYAIIEGNNFDLADSFFNSVKILN